MKKRAAILLLLTYCLLFFGSSYHHHPQEPQAALHCKVCAVSQAIVLPAATNVDLNTNHSEKLTLVRVALGSFDQVSAVSGRSPPTA